MEECLCFVESLCKMYTNSKELESPAELKFQIENQEATGFIYHSQGSQSSLFICTEHSTGLACSSLPHRVLN